MKLQLLFPILLLATTAVAQDFDLEDIVCKESSLLHRRNDEKWLHASPLSQDFDLKYYRFEWEINPAEYFISGTATVYFQALRDQFDALHFDFSSQLNIDRISYHGQALQGQKSGDYLLTIPLPQALADGTLDSISITYSGAPPSNGFGSFVKSTHNGQPVLWTLSEPYGAQDWWPCKNGLEDKIDSIDVFIATPSPNKAASNGTLIQETTGNATNFYHWKHRYPIAPYLIAFSVTNYEAYTDLVPLGDGSTMPMLNYIYPENIAQAKPATSALVMALQYYDSLFHRYPFKTEKYGHAQFGWGGGMEHQTMSFVSGFSWGLLTHELAHQWFGDMVTCGSWEDIWLNEGFATYLEGLSRERFIPSQWQAWKQGKLTDIVSRPDGSVWVSDTTSVNRIFSGRLSYSKGAYLLNMLRWKLGEETFFEGIRQYLKANEYQYATTGLLRSHLEQVSGEDLEAFFNDWFFGQGYPSYHLTWDQHSDQHLLIEVQQTTSHPSVPFFEMPVPVRILGLDRDTMLRLDNRFAGQIFETVVPFEVIGLEIDPELWLISNFNTVNRSSLTGIPNMEGVANLKLYPNPANNELFFESTAGMSFQVFNVLGQLVLYGTTNTDLEKLNISELPKGWYQIRLLKKNSPVESGSFLKQ